MKTKLFFITFILSTFFCHGQRTPTIKKIEVYALPFMSTYLIAVDKNDIKKMNALYVRIVSIDQIAEANISCLTANLEKSDHNQFPYDYRAMIILHYSNSKSYTYYVASGSGGIVNGHNLYDVNYPLIAAIYSFLPDNYFTSFYKNYPEAFE